MRDTRTMWSQLDDCGETGPIPEHLKDLMRRLVCANAVGDTHAEQVADADELMRMMGVHPDYPDELDYTLAPPASLNQFVS